jgi:hypothetical protein
MEANREGFQGLQDAIASVAEDMRRESEALQAAMRPLVEMIQQSAQAKPAVMPYLIDRGWFVTMDLPLGYFVALEESRLAGRHDEADAAMCRFAREQVNDTERRLGERFPLRTAILADAFAAHREGRHALSIPVLLAQADGIGREILGGSRQFFNTTKRSKALKDRLAAFELIGRPYTPWGVVADMLGQLDRKISIEEDTDLRDARKMTDDWFGPLNRHGVLHGLDIDYPSEANSLRCVLLLRYLLDTDRLLRQDIPERIAELNRRWEGIGPDSSTPRADP